MKVFRTTGGASRVVIDPAARSGWELPIALGAVRNLDQEAACRRVDPVYAISARPAQSVREAA